MALFVDGDGSGRSAGLRVCDVMVMVRISANAVFSRLILMAFSTHPCVGADKTFAPVVTFSVVRTTIPCGSGVAAGVAAGDCSGASGVCEKLTEASAVHTQTAMGLKKEIIFLADSEVAGLPLARLSALEISWKVQQ
jgi:hypothetical protein